MPHIGWESRYHSISNGKKINVIMFLLKYYVVLSKWKHCSDFSLPLSLANTIDAAQMEGNRKVYT